MTTVGAVEPVYEQIGSGYSTRRQPEPRWEAHLTAALEGCEAVVNVGAGAGSYEPRDRRVVAIEPSPTMLRQRPVGASPAVLGVAERLPLADRMADAALAVLTVHHWTDAAAGLAEMRRVAPRQVVLTWDPSTAHDYWLVADYLPEIATHESDLATLQTVVEGLRAPAVDVSVEVLPVPADCRDGVLAAYWRRPEAYLDPSVRGAISGLSLLDQPTVLSAMHRLRADLADGTWAERNRHLLELDEIDLGYRLVVAR
jgi:ubiquinone/menaquinone biosynthesis C-methylase UbiE